MGVERLVVMGGSRNIGGRIAEDVVQRGGQAVCCSRQSGVLDSRVGWLQCDVTVDGQVKRCLQEAKRLMGGLDVVVYNAVYTQPSMLVTTSGENIAQSLAVNMKGALATAIAAAEIFGEESPGRLLLIGSNAWYGVDGNALYALSKASLVGLMESCEAHFAPSVMRTDVCVMGPVLSGVYAKFFVDPTGHEPMGAFMGAGRVLSEAETVFGILLLLLDRRGGGRLIRCTGGLVDLPLTRGIKRFQSMAVKEGG